VHIREFVELGGCAAEIAGVVLIIGGLLIASARFALAPKVADTPRYQRYRQDLGCAILLGFEALVAGDIVRTAAFTPTMDSAECREGKPGELPGCVNDAAGRECPQSESLDGDSNGLQLAGHRRFPSELQATLNVR
jgi:uncharacterized membrane protein